MSNSSIRIVIDPVLSQSGSMASDSSISSISSISSEIAGNDLNKWMQHKFRIDRVTKEFQILFEVVPNLTAMRGHISIDNLRMKNCFPEGTKNEKCTSNQVQCTSNKVKVCITPNRICDLIRDCDENEDELVNCGNV
jgi:anaplastic lymphoma kinase